LAVAAVVFKHVSSTFIGLSRLPDSQLPTRNLFFRRILAHWRCPEKQSPAPVVVFAMANCKIDATAAASAAESSTFFFRRLVCLL
jgi:hypothetical protein